jgi:DNA primase small subunit
MNIETKLFLKKKFTEYYTRHLVPAPGEIERREFGFGTLTDKIKIRHKSFRSEKDLHGFLRREAPYYISYSAAYYDYPANAMNEKVWRGAELIFDLDVPMKYLSSKQLEKVKKETQSLLDFLKGDYGIPDKEIAVNFSGSKGYHIHVSSENVKNLGREERREIVDYLTGKINFRDYLKKIVAKDEIEIGPKKGDKGWPGRIYKGLYEFINDSTEKDLMEIPGIGEKKAKTIMNGKERLLKALAEGRYDLMPEIASIERQYMDRTKVSTQSDPNFKTGRQYISRFDSPLIQKIIENLAIHMEAEDTDKMVSIDTSRLIRLPDTLHGGSGLAARRVTDLEKFDPLTDALAFGGEKMKIGLREQVPVFEMSEQSFGPFDPGIVELPEYAALYLLLKDLGEAVA